MEQTVYSVAALNTHIKELIDGDRLLACVCVRGELSNYKIYPSGHHYFTIKDAESSLRCVMFRQSASKLRFRPENGMNVLVTGRVSLYLRDGAYQLYATDLTPEGVGDLYVAFEQLKAKLEAEGLFDRAHKKPLPRYPERIALITSSAGAAVRDMIRVLTKRWPSAQIMILPVRVQGVEAPPEIAGAIRYANRWKLADLIITGRGGGSMEDLWAFNDERVARAIWQSDIPVISAVGHEPDVTISDYVADLRAATPSNAAELAVPDADELRQLLDSYDARLQQAVNNKISRLRRRLEDMKEKKVLQAPDAFFDNRRAALQVLQSRLAAQADRSISGAREKFLAAAAKLDAMSPLKVIARGYAIASDENGGILRSVSQIKSGDRIVVRLKDGQFGATAD